MAQGIKNKTIVALVLSLSLSTLGYAKETFKEPDKVKAQESYGKLPLYFIENQGQQDKKIKFYEKGSGHATLFTEKGVSFLAPTTPPSLVNLSFVNANKSPKITAEERQSSHVNYLIGNDPKQWKSNIPTYGAVRYQQVYDGVDVRFYGNNRQMEYDLIVAPGADPKKIGFTVVATGRSPLQTSPLQIAENGDLVLSSDGDEMRMKKPYVYQEISGKRVEVAGRFALRGQSRSLLGLEIAAYNKSYPLVINPVLVYSTYLGGNSNDPGLGIAVDGLGNVYITGETAIPFHGAFGGGKSDLFVTKMNADGSALVYSTYIGGRGNDSGRSIAVDSVGNAYITGYTSSINFPILSPFQRAFGGGDFDAFALKINADGSALIYATYLGGSGSDYGHGIATDALGNAYVIGDTNSTNFPTVGPIQRTNGGSYDVFITKLNADGSALVYATYLGKSGYDSGHSIAVDGLGNAYITGGTASANFPTAIPFQGAFGGGKSDIFVAKINAQGSALSYSTYLGGRGDDTGYAIAVDGLANAYITGKTASTNFPTLSPFQGVFGGGKSDLFLTKMNADGSSLVYSTYLGGSGIDSGHSIAVDGLGNAYITGKTASTNFPIVTPLYTGNGGGSDLFVTKMNGTGSVLLYSTYLAGSGNDYGHGIAVDALGNTYVSGNAGVFVTKIRANNPPIAKAGLDQTKEASKPDGVSITLDGSLSSDADSDPITYLWTGPFGITRGAIATVALPIGAYAVTLTVSDGQATTTDIVHVTVQDTTPPTIAAHADVPASPVSEVSTIVTYDSPTTFDLVDGSGTAMCLPSSGSLFALGSTTVHCNATDTHGNVATSTSFVLHLTAPPVVIAADLDIIANATSRAGAIVTYTSPVTSDAVKGSGRSRCLPASGSLFPLGDTTVTCATTRFVVHLIDMTPPVISVHEGVTAEATSATGTIVTYTSPVTSDAVDGLGIAQCLPTSGSFFVLGNTTVHCNAADTHKNVARPTRFVVHLIDTTPPVISAYADVTAEATSATGAIVTYTRPITSDAVDGYGTAKCLATSGSFFVLGNTTVHCNAVDTRGNVATSTVFVVRVVDTMPPVISAHADVTAEATSAAGAIVTYTNPETADVVDDVGQAICLPVSGATFQLGVTIVTCNTADVAGNNAVPSVFVVHIVDTTPPVISAHVDVTTEAISKDGAIVTYTSSATSDVVDGVREALCLPASGATFKVGNTKVTCNITDVHLNVANAITFVVHVIDTTPPVIVAHADVTAEATTLLGVIGGAIVPYTSPVIFDAVDGVGAATCLSPSGSFFVIGNTTVRCNATDAHGNVAVSTTFVVHLLDTTPPVIGVHEDVTAEATSSAGATVTYTSPVTSDVVDGPRTARCLPASDSLFAIGNTTVRCNATDANGNVAVSTTFVVHLLETTPPVIWVHEDVTAEATSATGAIVTYTSPVTSDAVDGLGTATCLPSSGHLFTLGDSLVICRATDVHGNRSRPTSFVVRIVP